jgi:hypothetical protein
MNEKEPLSKGEFQEWRENDFKHLVKKVWRIEGILYVLVPLVLAVLAAVLAV